MPHYFNLKHGLKNISSSKVHTAFQIPSTHPHVFVALLSTPVVQGLIPGTDQPCCQEGSCCLGGSWSLLRKGKARRQPNPSWLSWLHTKAKHAVRSSRLYLFNACSTHIQRGSLSYNEFSLLRFSLTQPWSVYSKQAMFIPCSIWDAELRALRWSNVAPFLHLFTHTTCKDGSSSFPLMKTHGQFTIRFLPLQYSDPN